MWPPFALLLLFKLVVGVLEVEVSFVAPPNPPVKRCSVFLEKITRQIFLVRTIISWHFHIAPKSLQIIDQYLMLLLKLQIRTPHLMVNIPTTLPQLLHPYISITLLSDNWLTVDSYSYWPKWRDKYANRSPPFWKATTLSPPGSYGSPIRRGAWSGISRLKGDRAFWKGVRNRKNYSFFL